MRPHRPSWVQWATRVLSILEAIESIQYLLVGLFALGAAGWLMMRPAPVEKGTAVQSTVQEGHDLGILIFGCVGVFALLIGAIWLVSAIRDYRRSNDGKWG